MCGIAGVALWDGRRPDASWVESFIDAQRHRGPDGCGRWSDGPAALAHNRLSIIDLEMGQQPMASADNRYVIVYNGELYNFKELREQLANDGVQFRTKSDTEVVLEAYARWGDACLSHLRGMYAFGVWDTLRQDMFVARDRLGIKPLHYWQTSTQFAFASELQALIAHPEVSRSVDVGALDLYLHYQYVPAPLSIFADVKKLEPGCSLRVSATTPTASPRRYWSLQFVPDRSLTENEWLDRLDEVVTDAVRCHLISDVPFGAFLSGGVDSTIVAAHMSRHLDQPLRTFTIGFDQAAYDERRFAAATAASLGATHHEEIVHVDKYELLDDLIFKLARHYGEPFADSSAIPTYCVSAVARSQVKMVLSGDGGDELFAGYNTYPNILANLSDTPRGGPWQQWLRRLNRTNGHLLDRALGPATSEALEQHDLYYAYFNNERRARLYTADISAIVAARERHGLIRDFFAEAGSVECLSALQYLDIKTYLPGDILTKVDIAAMSHSLEVRVPLLDHRVVELSATIPPEFKLFTPDGTVAQKYLLKKYVNRLVPGDAFARPKQGFGVPIDSWFSNELFDTVRRRLLEESGVLSRLFARAAREELVSTPAAAFANAPRIWSLLFLQAWTHVYGIKL